LSDWSMGLDVCVSTEGRALRFLDVDRDEGLGVSFIAAS
jgi:hypothetical protein